MTGPLRDKTVWITRASGQSADLKQLLEAMGLRVIEVPTLQVRARPAAELDSALDRIAGCDWLLLTSANTVRILLDRARATGRLPDLKGDASLRICTVGPATARSVADYGLPVALLPSRYQAEGVLEELLAFHRGNLKGLRILLPRARKAREILPDTLREHGAAVEVIPVYDTVLPEEGRSRLQQILSEDPPDLITLTSSSTVSNLIRLAGSPEPLLKFRYAAIGPITAATARDHDLSVVVQARKSAIPDLAEAIREYFEPPKPA